MRTSRNVVGSVVVAGSVYACYSQSPIVTLIKRALYALLVKLLSPLQKGIRRLTGSTFNFFLFSDVFAETNTNELWHCKATIHQQACKKSQRFG
jgi:hypothetical protein